MEDNYTHPLREMLQGYHVVLASASPRRKHLLQGLDIPFSVRVKETDETYPVRLKAAEITEYLAIQKARAFGTIPDKTLIITADTIVWLEDKALMKPQNPQEAEALLRQLSGRKHRVISSVCIYNGDTYEVLSDTTDVYFKKLSTAEIRYYIHKYKPFDKAGSYGIQEWIGYIGIQRIEGSFYNVMGLPVDKLYLYLSRLLQK